MKEEEEGLEGCIEAEFTWVGMEGVCVEEKLDKERK